MLRNHLHMPDNPGEALADIAHFAGPDVFAELYERHERDQRAGRLAAYRAALGIGKPVLAATPADSATMPPGGMVAEQTRATVIGQPVAWTLRGPRRCTGIWPAPAAGPAPRGPPSPTASIRSAPAARPPTAAGPWPATPCPAATAAPTISTSPGSGPGW